MGETFFISDLHFGHKNVLGYDNRPWLNIEDHDNALIENWNDQVGYKDEVYILGDVSWHNVTKTIQIMESLNGNKHLIIGNHDSRYVKNPDFRKCFNEVVDYKELGSKDDLIVLCHYPITCFKNHYYGAFHLYGHVHNTYEWNMMKYFKKMSEDLYDKPCNMYNVGVMIPYMDWSPQTLETIRCENV